MSSDLTSRCSATKEWPRECFLDENKNTGGNNGATLGVSDMDKSVKFYSSIMDYDKVEYDVTDTFDDLKGVPGFIHLCFDIRNMEKIREAAAQFGHEFVCDGGRDFKMGEANGHFTYIEDPDGTLIEFVETFRIPILKKFGIYLNLEGRDVSKPLPGWILKCLRFMKS